MAGTLPLKELDGWTSCALVVGVAGGVWLTGARRQPGWRRVGLRRCRRRQVGGQDVDVTRGVPNRSGRRVGPCVGSTSCCFPAGGVAHLRLSESVIWRPGSCSGTEGASGTRRWSRRTASLPLATWLVWCSGGAKGGPGSRWAPLCDGHAHGHVALRRRHRQRPAPGRPGAGWRPRQDQGRPVRSAKPGNAFAARLAVGGSGSVTEPLPGTSLSPAARAVVSPRGRPQASEGRRLRQRRRGRHARYAGPVRARQLGARSHSSRRVSRRSGSSTWGCPRWRPSRR